MIRKLRERRCKTYCHVMEITMFPSGILISNRITIFLVKSLITYSVLFKFFWLCASSAGGLQHFPHECCFVFYGSFRSSRLRMVRHQKWLASISQSPSAAVPGPRQHEEALSCDYFVTMQIDIARWVLGGIVSRRFQIIASWHMG